MCQDLFRRNTMKIVNVKVKNFRVLNELEIELNDINSYLIGENNLGKSTVNTQPSVL